MIMGTQLSNSVAECELGAVHDSMYLGSTISFNLFLDVVLERSIGRASIILDDAKINGLTLCYTRHGPAVAFLLLLTLLYLC